MSFYTTAVERACDSRPAQPVEVQWFTLGLRLHAGAEQIRDYVASQHHLVAAQSAQSWVDIHAVADPRLLNAISAAATRRSAAREAFKGDWYGRYDLPGGEIALLSERGNAACHAMLTRDFRCWAIIGERCEDMGLLVTRTVRELVREELLARGGLMFHGAAAQTPDGKGVFFAGASGVGKTSAAVRCALGGGHVVGTDRTFLVHHAGHWLAVGLPMSTRLGWGSANALGVVDMLGEQTPIRGLNPFAAGAVGPTDKVSLSNAEMHKLLGCGFLAATRADRVVVLETEPGGCVTIEDLKPDQAVAKLSEHMLTPDPDYRSRWLSADGQPEDATAAHAHMVALAADRPVIRMGWDPALHCDENTGNLLTV